MTPSARKGLQEILWLSCLLWGFLLMIAAATEGFPYTSIHIRSDLAPGHSRRSRFPLGGVRRLLRLRARTDEKVVVVPRYLILPVG